MKIAKRFAAIILSAIMFASVLILPSSAATVTMTQVGSTSNVTTDGAVKYSKYNVYGSQSEHTEEVDVLQFNPADGYIPMAFAAYAGSVSTLETHYTMATNKFGYETVGLINGAFFDLGSGRHLGLVITNGKIACAHSGYTGDVVAFDSNGKMSLVKSTLSYNLKINGVDIAGNNDFRYLNKTHSSTMNQWDTTFFYYDTSCGSVADSASAGYEVICQKMNDTDLVVGGTLTGKVLEVKANTYGTQFADTGKFSDRFVLYVKNSSAYASRVANLKAGDSVTISVEETVSASKEIMENAVSVITNVGTLVKDGVDLTLTTDVIGDHSTTTSYARGTVFGTKPDGTYVFFTSEGGNTGDSSRSFTQRDIAAAMIKLGCTNVIRLDGGGSTAMYTHNGGYLCYSSRAVADCLMIVKKTSLVDSALTDALKSAVNVGKAAVASASNSTISSLVYRAEALLASKTIVSSDARKLIMELQIANDIALKAVINKADATDKDGYTSAQLVRINTAYEECKDLYKATYFDVIDIDNAITALEKALDPNGTAPPVEPEYEITAGLVTATNSSNLNNDGNLCYYPNNTSSPITLSSDTYNFRYAYILVCDSSGAIVEAGNNLLTSAQDSADASIDYQNEFTVPAGGFAISFFYNTSNTANQNAMDFYNAIAENCEYDDKTPTNGIYNETVSLKENDTYFMEYSNGVVTFKILNKTAINGLLGDVNGDESIDTRDYVLVARSYMGTYTVTADQARRADVNGDSTIDTRDYVLIARHYMGTYKIGQ